MKLRLLLAAATCLALPLAAAHAQPVTGPYISLGAGTSISNPIGYGYDQNEFGLNYHASGKLQSRNSYAGVAAAGYGFGNGFRVELGGDFYRNSFHASDATQTSLFNTQSLHQRIYGGENTYGPMFNALYDMNIGLPVFPYVGAGVGYQWVSLSRHVNISNNGVNSFGSETISGTQGSFAYQIIAGLSYPIAAVPGLSLTGEYRFMQLVQSRHYNGSFSNFNGQQSSSKVSFGQQSSHTFLVGLRYQLFPAPVMAPAPAPAPMAAPAPAPAKTYLVFFDWDKYNLTPRATQIIAEAAADSKTTKVTKITVSGYTDTSGTATYNQSLSVKRAKAVAVKLMADGVPASEISIFAYGETHLLVPTGPNVREPQNRRVEIVLN
ncbi:MAG: hypothetical protein B7Z75_13600 [Acidocella sp. 20-57-95]|nr:MAG: hypothetical protein B7Z75_13600 [Acidocella sp. 20-57-95]OYV62259.1 MAG: hypothetical protein B7Z71_01845 [Acidocella sp. 21-58-7]HQT63086.1 OmpA family protein [Acidocella sp.]HQU03601.1 OmpA family protein [Acidocella sp.]